MLELLVLLLPVAFVSGWYTARRSASDDRGFVSPDLRPDYFRGINYLLNEQPDKAIEAFIRVLEVDSETVETHLALGNLYRRRGEVDRAIRIHQNLIARGNLSREQHYEGLLELGQDYLRAGLLDRAENLFLELSESRAHNARALRQLLEIYERERDWDKAVGTARSLERVSGKSQGAAISQYLCEMAESEHQRGDVARAILLAREALEAHRVCVRASLLEADLLSGSGDDMGAIAALWRVESQDRDYVPETVERLVQCHLRLGTLDELAARFSELVTRHEGTSATIALAEIKRQREGMGAALDFMTSQLQQRASVRGLDHLLGLEIAANSDGEQRHLRILKSLTGALMAGRPVYKCRHCGFPARSLHWQCPGCKHWAGIKPIQGVEGE